MKYVFKTWDSSGFHKYEWYEITDATPSSILKAGFLLVDLRTWFHKWVFK